MPAAPIPFTLELGLPKRPSLTVETSTLEHGKTRYTVRGPRMRGTFIVVPVTNHSLPFGTHGVLVRFGDGPNAVRPHTARADEPVMNGVRIHGATEMISPQQIHRQQHLITSHAVVLIDHLVTRRIPDGARALTQAVVTALVQHWQRRPDRGALIDAALRHAAPDHVTRERARVRALQLQLDAVRVKRAHVRRRSYQLAGLVRRQQPGLRPPEPIPARLPLISRDGAPIGYLIAREHKVNVPPGRVVYEISGPRISPGLITVGPGIHSNSPVPEGLYTCWGRPMRPDAFTHECTAMPAINRVVMSGGWHHGSGDVRTAATSVRGSTPTAVRADAILRAVATRYLARPDLTALRIAAGKQNAARLRDSLARELKRVRADEARLHRRLRTHQGREAYFLTLLEPPRAEEQADGA
ncbi:hypothetical protein ACIG3E_32945 [Streptomyces sp. NPDC053474]|uniref:hypothetical protein n=1 Tax=Streptomyces sp. NPDC053474 TaxID=3365704 RepID=UPI0037D60FAD